MVNVRLGKTDITVNKNGFGALPIQRISVNDAVCLLHKAYDGGINFYDTARMYTDSEEKLGAAFSDRSNQYGGFLEGSRNHPAQLKNGLSGYLPVSQSGLLPEAGR